MKKFDSVIRNYISEQLSNNPTTTINIPNLEKAKISPNTETTKFADVLKAFGLNINPALGVESILKGIETLNDDQKQSLEQELNKNGLSLQKLNPNQTENQEEEQEEKQTTTQSSTPQTQSKPASSPTSYSAQGPKA